LKNPYSTKADPPAFRIEEAAVETLNGKSVHQCLRQRFSTLTALEARVISVILSQCTIDDKTLLKVVADETHVSKAMLVKIAKKLGFDGFRSLRAALAKHNRLPLAKARQELSDQPTVRALAEKARGASLKALEQAFSLVSFEILEQGRPVALRGPAAGLLRPGRLCPSGPGRGLQVSSHRPAGLRLRRWLDDADVGLAVAEGGRRGGFFVYRADPDRFRGRAPSPKKRRLRYRRHK
jgi:hypothetical protein